MVEVFSGSGSMAAAFRDLVFLTLAVDKASNVHQLRHSFVPLDLTRSDHQQLLLSTLDDAALVGVLHLGVPCGTCSRARERALPRRLRDRFRDPAPLRDARFPLGKPGLRGADRDRVRSANELYKFALRLLVWAYQHDVPCVIENPSRSWLWPVLESLIRTMTAELGPDLRRAWKAVRFYDLDACQFGGKRKKRTRLASSADPSALAQDCDGRHSHLQFDTAEEAQYPSGLCAAMASLFRSRLQSSGRASWPDASPPPFASGRRSAVDSPVPSSPGRSRYAYRRPVPDAGLISGGNLTRPGKPGS